MNVLLTGANGFIGKYLLAALLRAGHRVIPAVRHPDETDRLLPEAASLQADFNTDTRVEDWLPRLRGIDAVINCAGILAARPGQSIEAIHVAAPRALFAACARAGLRRVIQISAISAEAGAGTDYARTKREADEALAALDLDWVILRPSLVYARGAYGGTSLFRALAALPLTPLIGDGDQRFQPIHVDDVAATVLRLLDEPHIRRVVIDPVGPEDLSLRSILADLRRWLGLPPAPAVPVPRAMVNIAARAGDVLGGPVNTTALRQMDFGNTGSHADFVAATGIRPRRWHEALLAEPAQAQDRWHARLYFVRPLLRVGLALLWLVSGAVGLLRLPEAVTPVAAASGLNPGLMTALGAAGCGLDLVLGWLVLLRYRPGVLALLQFATVAGYTAALTIWQPLLWMDPYGPLLKNLPIVAAVLALWAIEPER